MRVRCPVIRGVVRMGPYRPGQIYDVPEEQARRLMAVKGFEAVDPDPEPDPAPIAEPDTDDDYDAVMED